MFAYIYLSDVSKVYTFAYIRSSNVKKPRMWITKGVSEIVHFCIIAEMHTEVMFTLTSNSKRIVPLMEEPAE